MAAVRGGEPLHGLFVYLHGYGGSPAGRKASVLRRHLYPHRVLCPAVPADPGEAVPFLEAFVRRAVEEYPECDKCVLIGSSLGGYYAQYLARVFGTEVVLINPVMDPRSTFLAETLAEGQLGALDACRVDPRRPVTPTLLLVDLGDEVLDATVAVEAYTGVGHVIAYPGGSHDFDHLEEAVPEILRHYYTLTL